MRSSTALAIGLILILTACAGGSDSTEAPASTSASAPATTAAPAGACPADPFTGTIERTAQAETSTGTHVAAARRDRELVSAHAYSFGTGDTYTVYVGDHEIDRDGVGSDTLVAPQCGLLATIFLFSDEQLAAGSTVAFSFVPIVDTGGGAEISGFGADDVVGSMTVIDITEERICFQIDSTDPQQRLVGTVSAEIT